MQKLSFTFLLLLGVSFGSVCQQTLFENRYAAPVSSYCHNPNTGFYGTNMAFYDDGSILVLANCTMGGDTCNYIGPSDNLAIRLVKLNPDGDTLWTRIIMNFTDYPFNPTFLIGTSIIRTGDGNFIIAGEIQPGSISLVDAFLMKIDSEGNVLWRKDFSEKFITHFTTVVETADQGFLAGGYTSDSFGGEQVMFMVKSDNSGMELWRHTYGDGFFGECRSISDNHNGVFTILGKIMMLDGTSRLTRFLLLNINAVDGSEISRHLPGDPGKSRECSRGIPTHDHKFMMVGWEAGPRNFQLCAIKTGPDGLVEWHTTHGDSLHSYYPNDVQETCDSGYIVTGMVKLCHLDPAHPGWVNCDTMKCLLVKISKEGNIEWEKIWGFEGDWLDVIYSIKKYDDQGFIAIGGADAYMYSIRYDSVAFCRPLSVNENKTGPSSQPVLVYPVPIVSVATIEVLNYQPGSDLEFVLCDIFGKEIKKIELKKRKNKLVRGNIPAGMYFFRIFDHSKSIQSGKIILPVDNQLF